MPQCRGPWPDSLPWRLSASALHWAVHFFLAAALVTCNAQDRRQAPHLYI